MQTNVLGAEFAPVFPDPVNQVLLNQRVASVPARSQGRTASDGKAACVKNARKHGLSIPRTQASARMDTGVGPEQKGEGRR